jgi:formylglycine-generating enzyme required for sulfatase activity
MKLVLVPAGEFLMGSPDADKDAEDEEKPRHRVHITRPFYLGVTEVTVGQFRRFVDETGHRTEAESDGKGGWGWNKADNKFEQDPKYTWDNPGFLQTEEHPVVNVSWNDAIAFCTWQSNLDGLKPFDHVKARGPWDGKGYRLPTEAEWEYACRAGTNTLYQSGDDPETLKWVGNVADATAKEKYPDWTTITARDGYVYTAPVRRFRANAFELYDMHGNVWEWCWDQYDEDYYGRSPGTDPLNLAPAAARPYRGGSWYDDLRDARAAHRPRCAPSNRLLYLGFRVARVLSDR